MISKKYKKKPVIIEAVQYERDKNISSCMDFCPDMIYNREDNEYDIVTLEGRMRITKGDFIIKGVNGEFYPCKPDIFEKTYEPAAISKTETTTSKTETVESKEKCWRKGGCMFNSNNSPRYMKCWQQGYSVQQCEFENYVEPAKENDA